MHKKQITKKLQLNKETLRSLAEGDLRVAVGGITQETCKSDCFCISWDSCPPTWPC